MTLCLLLPVTLCACSDDDDSDVSLSGFEPATEAVSAFNLINQVRQNPAAFSESYGVDLSSVEARGALVWNDTLAKVAQDRVEDMVKRKYFSHVDPSGYAVNFYINKAGYTLNENWYSDKASNYFESIAAGNAEAEAMVRQLIYDSGRSNDEAGHRSHLLGISSWNASLTDCGIGYAYGPETQFKHYWSVIIAKHNF